MSARCVLTLSLALTGCFGPTGSAATTTGTETTDAATTTPVSTSAVDTSTTEPNSTGPVPTTGAPEFTGTTSSGGTDSTTSTDTTDASSTGVPTEAVCGNMIKEDGEECDDPFGNGDDRPCTLACKLAVCGDLLHCRSCPQVEECDNGNENPDDGCTEDCRVDGRLIFATATLHPGDIGLEAADQICTDLGVTYFSPDRTFVAWMSTSDSAIIQRLNGNGLPYRLPGLQRVFANTPSLLQGLIEHNVDQDPLGTTIEGLMTCAGGVLVWTGSTHDGKLAELNCDDWSTTQGLGQAGNAKVQNPQWSYSCTPNCSEFHRLYCIQVKP